MLDFALRLRSRGVWVPAFAGTTKKKLLLRNPIDLCHLVRTQIPVDRLDVLLDLLDAGGAGDHACDLRPACEPGERQFKHGVVTRLCERLQLFDDLLVARRDVAVAQPRYLVEARVVGRGFAALVFAGEETAGKREER